MSESTFGPLGQPLRARPTPVPRVATAPLDIVCVDLTRPFGGAFQVRVFDEYFRPFEADVVALHVFYGIEVGRLAGRIAAACRASGIPPVQAARHVHYAAFDFKDGFEAVAMQVERLAGAFPP